ncbi:hypothetical protein HWV62_23675 [Athelia sp. TMB]|nr:hypothetical protein HWV62_23675 [Athelia sp. TMB]
MKTTKPVKNRTFEEITTGRRSGTFVDVPLKSPKKTKRVPKKVHTPPAVEIPFEPPIEDGDPYAEYSKSSNDYMREFITIRHEYLNKIMESEAPPLDMLCSVCKIAGLSWKCLDCVGGCPAWLYQAGVEIHLGHDGEKCPSSLSDEQNEFGESWTPWKDTIPGDNEQDDVLDIPVINDPINDQDAANSFSFPRLKKRKQKLIIDRTGVHPLTVNLCCCPDAEAQDIQYLATGFLPATFDQVETVFTFQMLDDLRVTHVECHTPVMNYWHRLRRITAPLQPQSVPNRYREMMRALRQWRNMELRKRAGFAYIDTEPGPGELVEFCSACPQDGFNLRENWQDDPEEYKYSRDICLDGNFSADQTKMKCPDDDVHLTNGDGFMVTESLYQAHLKAAVEVKQKRTCHRYDAMENSNMSKVHLLYTGIGAAACARHGCFIPHAVVNFTKGEKFMNMDMATSEANRFRMQNIKRSTWYYDIMCQYWVHLVERFEANPHLHFPGHLKILRAIGLFHVHGHQDDCFAKFAPTYVPGAGLVDGEILETLWAVLNHVSGSTRSQSTSFRRETLDDHMNDSNWKKLISQGTWARDEQEAQNNRWHEPDAMRIYDIKINKGKKYSSRVTKAQMQVRLLEEENKRNDVTGRSALIAEGLKLEEEQLHLITMVRRVGKSPTVSESLEIETRRQRLQKRVDKYNDRARIMWPLELHQQPAEYWQDELVDVASDASDDEEDGDVQVEHYTAVERVTLHMPSTIGMEICTSMGYADAAAMEKKLRIGQQNDGLQNIRVAISRKACIFREGVRAAKSKKKKTRSWDHIHAVDHSVRHNCRVYERARRAMLKLNPSDAERDRYKPLTKADLKVDTARVEPGLRGHRGSHLAWFWTMDIADDIEQQEGMVESLSSSAQFTESTG